MFTQIFLFELKYRLKRPATYIYFFIFFLMSFLAVTTDAVTVGGSAGKVWRNSPFVLNTFVTIFSIFGIFVSSAVMGVPVYRDLEHRMDTFFYALPFSKTAYLAGRFLGSFLVLTFIMAGVGLGMLLGSFMPWVDAETLGPVHLSHYLHTYLVFMIPTTLLTGTIFFSLVALSRRVVAAYAGTVVLFVAYIISNIFTEDLDNQTTAALLDPFGLSTSAEVTKYWTVAEKNTQVVAFSGLVLYNRLIWLGVSFLLLGLTFWRFRLGAPAVSAKKVKLSATEKPGQAALVLPPVQQRFSLGVSLRQMVGLAGLEFRNVTRDIYFLSILFAGIVFLFLDGWYMDRMFGTTTYPVTYNMLQIKDDTYSLLMLVILVMFTGEMVWRERQLKFSQILDAFPVPNWVFYGSKFLALVLICLLLVSIVPIAGIAVQTVKGYYNYELPLYFKELYFITFVQLLTFSALCFFVHNLVNNKFLGLFVIVAYMVINIVLVNLDFRHPLYRFNATPGYTYSDMNGYGHFVEPLVWFRAYWALLALALGVIGNMIWNRGVETDFRNRLKVARNRWRGAVKPAFSFSFIAFAGLGGFIFYNTNVLNIWEGEKSGFARLAKYERTYKKYEGIRQPRITDVRVHVDIFPDERRADAKGRFLLQNKTDRPIDSLHVLLDRETAIRAFTLGGRPVQPLYTDKDLGYHIYALSPALAPGEQTELGFDLGYASKGFRASKAPTSIVANGTFFNSSVLPTIGYDANFELSDNKERKKLDLPEKARMPDLHDSTAYANTYISHSRCR